MPAPELYEQLRDVAAEVAADAATLVARLREHAVLPVATKSSRTDVVTAADTAAERAVRDLLARRRPGEVVLGEEEGGAPAVPGSVSWVVDPIDGTVNYLYGLPWYAVSVAAQRDGRTLAGAVVQPGAGRCFAAARGGGATLNGSPIHASTTTDLGLTLLATGFSYRVERRARQAELVARLLPAVRDVRRAGSAALDLCSVACGWVDAYVEHGLNRWDWAAGALIAEEAGATVRLPRNGGSSGGAAGSEDGLGADAVLAAAPGVYDRLAALLHKYGGAAI